MFSTSYRTLCYGGLICLTLLFGRNVAVMAQQTHGPSHSLQQCFSTLMSMRKPAKSLYIMDDAAATDPAQHTLRERALRCLEESSHRVIPTTQLGMLAVLQAEAGTFAQSLATYQRYLAVASIPATRRDTSIEEALPVFAGVSGASAIQELRTLVSLADRLQVTRSRVNTRMVLARVDRRTGAYIDSYRLLREVVNVLAQDHDATTFAQRARLAATITQMSRRWSKEDRELAQRESVMVLAQRHFSRSPRFLCAIGACVGLPAPPIEAPRWFNLPSGVKPPRFGDGNIYVVEFTAEWCLPCRSSYPSLIELTTRYASRGLRVLFVTALYGYFGNLDSLTPAVELDSLRRYFLAEHHIQFPIAVDGDLHAPAGTDQGRDPVMNVDGSNYNAFVWPTVVLIDRTGIVRQVWSGWDSDIQDTIVQLVQAPTASP